MKCDEEEEYKHINLTEREIRAESFLGNMIWKSPQMQLL